MARPTLWDWSYGHHHYHHDYDDDDDGGDYDDDDGDGGDGGDADDADDADDDADHHEHVQVQLAQFSLEESNSETKLGISTSDVELVFHLDGQQQTPRQIFHFHFELKLVGWQWIAGKDQTMTFSVPSHQMVPHYSPAPLVSIHTSYTLQEILNTT